MNSSPGDCSAIVNGLSPIISGGCAITLQTWTMSGATVGSSDPTGVHDVSGEEFNVGITTVTYHVEDGFGNWAECDFTVEIVDNELPSITCPVDVIVPNDVDACSAVVGGLTPVTSDNCLVTLQTWELTGATTATSAGTGINDASGQTFNVGVTTVSYHIEDAAGNEDNCSFTVTVNDTQAPNFTVPPDATVCRNIDETYDISPGITGEVNDEWDNCAVGIIASYVDDFANLTSSETAGYVIRTWSLSDGNGQITNKPQIIWVEPVAQVIPVVSESVICDSTETHIELTSPNVFTTGDVTFNYEVINPPAGVSGFTSPVVGLSVGEVISDLLINVTTEEQVVTYRITPVAPNGCSTGNPVDVPIIVNPKPQLDVSFSEDILCNNSNVTIDVSDLLKSSVGERYYWLARDFTEDSLYIIGGPLGEDYNPHDKTYTDPITDSIVNNSKSLQTVSYQFYPVIKKSPDVYCVDENFDFGNLYTVWINPTPRLSVEVSETIVCDSSTVSFNVVDSLISYLGESRYHLVREYDDSQVKIEGETPDTIKYVEYGSFEDQIINLVMNEQIVRYTFIPVIQDPRGDGADCSGGEPWTETIIVNPTPRLSVSIPEDKEIYCNEEIVTFSVNDELDGATGITYYQVSSDYDPASIELIPVESGGEYGTNYTDQIINKTAQVQTVTYNFYAYINDPKGTGSSAPCSYLDTVITIDVLPTPDILVVDSDEDDKLCNLDYIDFAITNPNLTTGSGEWKYILEVDYGDSIRGQYMDYPQYYFDDVDLNIADTLENLGTTYFTVSYHFIPYIISDIYADNCPTTINDTTIYIIVDPKPAIRVTAADSVICNNTATDITVHNPHKFSFGNWEYNLVVIPDPEIEGARGDTTIRDDKIPIIDTLINNDTVVHQVKYYFYPLKNIADSLLCEGGDTTMVTIWVNPTPEIRVTADDTIICDGETFNLWVRNPNDSVRGDWSYDLIIHADPSLAGIPHDTVYSDVIIESFQYTLYNTGKNEGEVTFHFIPSITDDDWNPNDGDCDGLTYDSDTRITIYVQPVPEIEVTADRDSVICNNTEVNLNMTNPNKVISGEWSYDLIITADPEIGGISSDTLYNQIRPDSTIYLFNYDTINYDSHRVTFEFIPHISPDDGESECENGIRDTLTFWVNPTPKMSVVASDNIFCDGEEVSFTITDEMGNVPYTTRWYKVVAAYIPTVIDVEGRDPGVASDPEVLMDTVISDRLFNIDEFKGYGEVIYYFTPILRIDANGRQCQGDPITIKISVNPTPEIEVTMYNGSYLCDSSEVHFEVVDQIGQVTDSIVKVYDLSVEFDNGKVLNVSIPGLRPGELPIRDTLDNITDTFQVVKYYFTPRLMDTRIGHEGKFCEGVRTDSFIVYVNPTPKIQYQLMEDTLCYNDGFILSQDFKSVTTHPMYFNMVSDNPDGLLNVTSTLDKPVTDTLLDEQIRNEGVGVGSVVYELMPYIDSLGCEGRLDTFLIKVNPLPTMYPIVADTAVCYNWGYQLPINTAITSTTGLLRYEFYTDTTEYNPAVMSNIPPPAWYDLNPLDTLDQSSVINSGRLIEPVEYYFIPVIEDAKGPGEHCWAKDTIRHLVEVAPELIGDIFADTTDYGGFNVTCYDFKNANVTPMLTGGYYYEDYNFQWSTTDGDGTRLVPTDSAQVDLDIGTYSYYMHDAIGCEFWDTIIITQPDSMWFQADITPAPCRSSIIGGSIYLYPEGGTGSNLGIPGYKYSYEWLVPYYGLDTTQHIEDGSGGPYPLTITDMNGCFIDTSLYMNWVDHIFIDIVKEYKDDQEQFNISCFGKEDGNAQVFVSGGTPGFELAVWNDSGYNATLPVNLSGSDYIADLNNVPAGVYNFVVTDLFGCESDPRQDTMVQPDPLLISWLNEGEHFGYDISCYGENDGNIIIGLTGAHTTYLPYDFTWSGSDPDLAGHENDSILDFNGLDPGQYMVEVRDGNNWCIDTAYFELEEPPRINITDVSIAQYQNNWNVSCAESADGSIGILSEGGLGLHHYNWWKDGVPMAVADTSSVYELSGGTYQLNIVDSMGCIRDTSFIIREPNPLAVLSVISDTNGWEIACYSDSSGSIQLAPYGGADSTQNAYFWSTPDGFIQDTFAMDQTGLTAGTYTVRVTDLNNCITDSTFVLYQPEMLVIDTIESDSASCFNTPSGGIRLHVTGGYGEYNYLWSPGDQMADPTVEDPGGLRAGVYTVIVTDENGCVVDSSVEVFEGDRFSLRIDTAVNYNGYPISCYGESDGAIDLEAIGGTEPHTFEWSNGAITEDLEGLPAGTYSVVVTDFYGCEDSATIELFQPAAIEYAMQTSDPRCFNDSTGSIELMITGGTAYALDDYNVLLNNVLAEPFMYNLPEGNYLITIVDLNECWRDTVVDLTDPEKLVLSFDTEEAFCKDKPDGQLSLNIDGGVYPYYITWDRGLTDGEDDFMDVYWGEYVATVTDANECVVSDTAFVGYKHISCLVIPNAFSPNSDGFNDLWIIEGLELYPQAELRIFDRWGTSVYHSRNAADDPWDGTLNGRELPVDSYHYIINLNNGEDPETGNVTIVK